MASAMQLYAGFALLVIAIAAIISDRGAGEQSHRRDATDSGGLEHPVRPPPHRVRRIRALRADAAI
jgi:hypothetical protein